MNQKDTYGLMEDLTKIGIINAGQENARRSAAKNSVADTEMALLGGVVAIVVRQQKETIAKLQADIARRGNERNDVAAASSASSKTIEEMTKEIAQLKGKRVEEVEAQVNRMRSKNYDQQVKEWLSQGIITEDLRADPENLKVRTWYTPAE